MVFKFWNCCVGVVYLGEYDVCDVTLGRATLKNMPGHQGCKLLSDIGQCPTKFGKCPSKSNFDRTLVRSQKKIVTYIFLL